LQTLPSLFIAAEPKSEKNGYHSPSSSLTLLPGASHIVNAPPVIDPDAKPGERLPYAKPLDYGEDWQVSGILHDFNNLLAIILSHTSVALTKLPADSPVRPNLERAVRATRRAADLSNQLSLSFSRRQDEVAYAEPNALIEEIVELLEPKIGAKAKLELQLAPELSAVAVPRLRIQQVLMNLLLNAAEAIYELPGRITVITANRHVQNHEPNQLGQQELPTGHYALIQVSDSGIGMDQETLNTIFEPYFTTKTTGTGVGLSTTLGIIHTYQGIMQVSSTPGAGSTFRVFLPALDA
jgi:two-component system, cell cycle sensor histidine kinase and response regulator CckA